MINFAQSQKNLLFSEINIINILGVNLNISFFVVYTVSEYLKINFSLVKRSSLQKRFNTFILKILCEIDSGKCKANHLKFFCYVTKRLSSHQFHKTFLYWILLCNKLERLSP